MVNFGFLFYFFSMYILYKVVASKGGIGGGGGGGGGGGEAGDSGRHQDNYIINILDYILILSANLYNYDSLSAPFFFLFFFLIFLNKIVLRHRPWL